MAAQFPTELTVLNKFAFFWPIWCVTSSASALSTCPHLTLTFLPSRACRHDDHLRLVHRTSPSHFSFHKPSPLAPTRDTPYTYHLWDSVAYDRYLRYYDPERVQWVGEAERRGARREEDGRNDESAFGREIRQWVREDFLERWREARDRREV